MPRNQSEDSPTLQCPGCDSTGEMGVIAPAYIWYSATVEGKKVTYNPGNTEAEETGDDLRIECAQCGLHFDKPLGVHIVRQ